MVESVINSEHLVYFNLKPFRCAVKFKDLE